MSWTTAGPNKTQTVSGKGEEIQEVPHLQQGVGWRKLTERGRLLIAPNGRGLLSIEGCASGFCLASYEGTQEEKAAKQEGQYGVEAVIKVSPGGAFDAQVMYVVIDMAKHEQTKLHAPAGMAFEDIVALSSAKEVLRENVLLPVQMPEILTGILEPSMGVMFFGPPGTGKTMLATALASTAGISFFRCSAASLTSKWRGESEKLIRALFKVARTRAPSVLFFDEVDAICSKRGECGEHEASRRVKAELLQQIDYLWQEKWDSASLHAPEKMPAGDSNSQRSPRIVVIAATNAPWSVAVNGAYLQLDASADLNELARRTEGFSCADLRSLCREAAWQPLRRILKVVSHEATEHISDHSTVSAEQAKHPVGAADFELALMKIRPSIHAKAALRYVEWAAEFGST
ncbi:katanin p60 ATPase-containing subunit A-like 1 [Cyclospora cayetanensis]|uniref:Katanin p60 ATPase-containing subunit A-like 1 n=1 Tax=Cyclospora cayetanensis TaxID=88456 RepID=A0A6P6S2W2_9EIME|nr:katanin p60 ATPase-containing subunit A-like 1 [Cyclospora cayetanensis]